MKTMNDYQGRSTRTIIWRDPAAAIQTDKAISFSLPCDDPATSSPRTFETSAGTLYLRDFCPASLVESLKVDTGLRAFARHPEREHQLLRTIAERSDSKLTLAYTTCGVIVGQVTLAPAGTRWDGLKNIYEIAIEVSSGWRRRRIAQQLLSLVFELDCLEKMIIIGLGLSWHWDMEGLGLTPFAYRAMIAELFARSGFAEYLTAEENICMDPANIFLARLGRRVEMTTISAFYDRMLASRTLPGM
jgi:hypothetical protein